MPKNNRDCTVRMNMAMTLDGRVVLPDGRWHGLTSEEDRRRMDRYRKDADALIVGKGSIVRDDPDLSLRTFPEPSRSDEAPRPVLVCRNELPPLDRKIFHLKKRRPLIFLHNRLRASSSGLGDCCEIVFFDDCFLPSQLISHLVAYGYKEILLEGGPTINYSFFKEDLVDVIYLTIVPHIIGMSNLPAFVDGPAPISSFQSKKWKLIRAEPKEEELFLEYHFSGFTEKNP